MRHETVATLARARVVLMDSISTMGPGEAGSVVVSGSHGGRISGAFALKHPPALVSFNDAGVGRNGAGIAALADLAQAGIPAVCLAHTSCRIGDAADAWARGLIAHVNAPAAALGLRAGEPLRQAVETLFDRGGA